MYDANFKEFFDVGVIAYTASFANILQQSPRDIMPQLGQMLQIGYGHAPLQASEIYKEYAFGATKLFVPGFMKHHSIELYGAYEWYADTSFYTIQSMIQMPRGFLTESYVRKDMISAHCNYTFPVWYPDFAWTSLLYVKRLYATVFVDYARVDILNTNADLVSVGLESMLNFHMFHIQVPLTAGPRITVIPRDNAISVEFKAAIDINGM